MTVSKKQRQQYLFWGGGVIFTIAWTIYVFSRESISLGALNGLNPNEFGDFFAGFAAPIAFFWFVLGILLQGKELGLQYEELTKSVEQQKNHAKTAEKNLEIETQNTIIRTCEFYTDRLAGEAAVLYSNTFTITRDNMNDAWQRHASGNKDVFARRFFHRTHIEGHKTTTEDKDIPVLLKNAIQASASANSAALRYYVLYLSLIANLEQLCEDFDEGQHLLSSYKTGPIRQLHDVLSSVLNRSSLAELGLAPFE